MDKENESLAKETKIYLDILRNIGIMSHIDARKTTTAKYIIYYNGYLSKVRGV